MNHEQAVERIEKLEALAEPGRGGTDAERRVARKKATVLRQRFGIKRARVPRPRRRPRRTFMADSLGGVEWAFNIYTGRASANVTVHRHTSPTSWKIEIDQEMGEAVASKRVRRRDAG